MTKELKKMSFMALAVMMLAGGFLLASGKSQHVMPKKAVAEILQKQCRKQVQMKL